MDPLRWLVSHRNPVGTVYGTVTAGTLLAAESGLRDTYPETVGSLVIAVILYWFAHSYAEVLGLRLSAHRVLRWSELWQAFLQDWAIVRGAFAPVAAVLICWSAGVNQSVAVTAGTWTAIASLILLELAAGVRSGARAGELALHATAGATLGIAILALRALLH